MNKSSLDQKNPLGSHQAAYSPTNLQRKSHSAIQKGSIMGRLVDFAFSIPDSRRIGNHIRGHWSIESMHWLLDFNMLQDRIKRKTAKAARNLDTIQRIVLSLFSIWRGRRKKLSDKTKGMAELMRGISTSFSKLMKFLRQK